jgi:hypothetical protein
MNAVKNRRTMADTLLHPCGSYAPCRRVEGSRVRFLYLDSSRPATRLQEHRAYPELFALLGGQVPDLRGLFLRGHGGNSAALGVRQGDAIRNISGTFGGHAIGWRGGWGSGPFYSWDSGDRGSGGNGTGTSWGFDASRIVPTAEENRPVNQSVRYLIRARP